MPTLTIITGAPGTGKTTVAALLARTAPRGLHIPSDVFYEFPAHPIPPHLPESRAQNTAMIAAMTRTAATFAAHGYDVFLDGIIGPWFLPTVQTELAHDPIETNYVVLDAPLALALDRVRGRGDGTPAEVVVKMHGEFADLGVYAHHRVDTTARTVNDVAAEMARLTTSGDLRLQSRDGHI